MRIFIIGLTIFINFVLQTTVFQYLAIFGIQPNTAIILIVSFAILRFEGEGAIIGFFTGLLQDIMFGDVIGIHAFLGMSVGYFCGKPFKDFYAENYLLPLFLVIGGTLFYEIAYYIIAFMFRNKLDIVYYFRGIIIPEVFYNALLSIPIYRLLYGINRKLELIEKPKRKLF